MVDIGVDIHKSEGMFVAVLIVERRVGGYGQRWVIGHIPILAPTLLHPLVHPQDAIVIAIIIADIIDKIGAGYFVFLHHLDDEAD